MSGTPIPGPHWLEVDLGAPAQVTDALLDWETAFATHWTLLTRLREGDEWRSLATGAEAAETRRTEQHVVQELALAPAPAPAEEDGRARAGGAGGAGGPGPGLARFVRLLIHEPATRWGASLWRLQLKGRWLGGARR